MAHENGSGTDDAQRDTRFLRHNTQIAAHRVPHALVVDVVLYDDLSGAPLSGAIVRVWLAAPDGTARAGGVDGLLAREDAESAGHYRVTIDVGTCPAEQVTNARAVAQGGTSQQRTFRTSLLPSRRS